MIDKNDDVCPLPISDYRQVLMAHGGGGKLMHQLVDKIFMAAFDNPLLKAKHDSAVMKLEGRRLAFTTDSYVVDPLFFPGGDIGTLAINGTVNDLAMAGARPVYLSAGFIIEEGFAIASLWKIAVSMAKAAREAGVQIVTGDTKVVDKGRGHNIFINTAGIGIVQQDGDIHPDRIQPGDAIIINGDIGRHGMAIMAEREKLAFEEKIESDCAPLAGTILSLIEGGIEIHCLRDLTRGGLAGSLVEIAGASGINIAIEEEAIPVSREVKAACEILGFDPIYIANEGRFVAFIAARDADRAIECLRNDLSWSEAVRIGTVSEFRKGMVISRTVIGAERVIVMLSGEQFPRIC